METAAGSQSGIQSVVARLKGAVAECSVEIDAMQKCAFKVSLNSLRLTPK